MARRVLSISPTGNGPLARIRTDLENARVKVRPSSAEETIYLFVSFDLANSTRYKAESRNWPAVMNFFYRQSLITINEVSSNFKLWKYNGDEALFYMPIVDFKADVVDKMRFIHNAMENVTSELQKKVNSGVLSVKGTMWIAKVTYPAGSFDDILADQPGEHRKNLIMFHETEYDAPREVHRFDRALPTDFLGQDIDIGFRISHFSHRHILALSADLAKLIFDVASNHEATRQIRIVDYVELKGVWSQRPYPIIWYYPDWNEIENVFYYFEDDKFDGVKRRIENQSERSQVEDRLNKIFRDVERLSDIDSVRQTLSGKR